MKYGDFSENRSLKSLSKEELEILTKAICKACDYRQVSDEYIGPLPKIIGKIEIIRENVDSYLIEGNIILSQKEVLDWIKDHRLDAIVVHEKNGKCYVRSRHHHTFWQMKMCNLPSALSSVLPLEKPIETIVRVVGEKKSTSCIWGFINGISNNKKKAIASIDLVVKATGNEIVYALPNDTAIYFPDLFHCGILKLDIDTPVVLLAEKYFHYLIKESVREGSEIPIVIFAHSQGAIIAEHALNRLTSIERNKIRIFTLGGGSFILPSKAHSDSHNYASTADLICRLGSPHLQILALHKHEGIKNDLNERTIISELARKDAFLQTDSFDARFVEAVICERTRYYEKEFEKISNLTILDAKTGDVFEHDFVCYLPILEKIVSKYQSG
ncbi:MAG: hypothetical protein FJZ59_02970 [Chlamydiae bacterium]|nr:hypothetical protein [Chlamydiota bacterium]